MARHPRFEEHRYLGDKRSFVVYDCDDDTQFALVEEIPLEEIASFGPDELAEARNRSFRPHGGAVEGEAEEGEGAEAAS